MLGFGVFEMEKFETDAADDVGTRRDDVVWPLGPCRNRVSKLRMFFESDTIADGIDLRRYGGQRVDRAGKRRRTEDVIRVIVTDVKARDRLAEGCSIGHHLLRIGERILRIN